MIKFRSNTVHYLTQLRIKLSAPTYQLNVLRQQGWHKILRFLSTTCGQNAWANWPP